MDGALGRWIRLNPDNVAGLPDEAGVFEIANLVRNVVYIGRGGGSVRRALETLTRRGNPLPANIGGYYVRILIAAAEDVALAERLADFQARHAGRLPIGNDERRPALQLAQREPAFAA